MSPKTKKILGWIFASLVALVAIGSAMGKLTATPDSDMGKLYVAMGFNDHRVLIACLEILSAVALLIPRTSTIGALLSSAYWGGAMATDLSHGQFPGPVLVIIAFLGITLMLRNPELFQRLLGKPVAA